MSGLRQDLRQRYYLNEHQLCSLHDCESYIQCFLSFTASESVFLQDRLSTLAVTSVFQRKAVNFCDIKSGFTEQGNTKIQCPWPPEAARRSDDRHPPNPNYVHNPKSPLSIYAAKSREIESGSSRGTCCLLIWSGFSYSRGKLISLFRCVLFVICGCGWQPSSLLRRCTKI